MEVLDCTCTHGTVSRPCRDMGTGTKTDSPPPPPFVMSLHLSSAMAPVQDDNESAIRHEHGDMDSTWQDSSAQFGFLYC